MQVPVAHFTIVTVMGQGHTWKQKPTCNSFCVRKKLFLPSSPYLAPGTFQWARNPTVKTPELKKTLVAITLAL